MTINLVSRKVEKELAKITAENNEVLNKAMKTANQSKIIAAVGLGLGTIGLVTAINASLKNDANSKKIKLDMDEYDKMIDDLSERITYCCEITGTSGSDEEA